MSIYDKGELAFTFNFYLKKHIIIVLDLIHETKEGIEFYCGYNPKNNQFYMYEDIELRKIKNPKKGKKK